MSKKRVSNVEIVQLRAEDLVSGKSIAQLFEDAERDGRVETHVDVEVTCVTPTEEQMERNVTVKQLFEEAEKKEKRTRKKKSRSKKMSK